MSDDGNARTPSSLCDRAGAYARVKAPAHIKYEKLCKPKSLSLHACLNLVHPDSCTCNKNTQEFQAVIDDLHIELFLNGFFHKCQRSALVSVVAEKQDVMSVTKTPRSNQIECVMKTCMQYVSKLLTDDCRNLVHARIYVEPARDAHMHAKKWNRRRPCTKASSW